MFLQMRVGASTPTQSVIKKSVEITELLNEIKSGVCTL